MGLSWSRIRLARFMLGRPTLTQPTLRAPPAYWTFYGTFFQLVSLLTTDYKISRDTFTRLACRLALDPQNHQKSAKIGQFLNSSSVDYQHLMECIQFPVKMRITRKIHLMYLQDHQQLKMLARWLARLMRRLNATSSLCSSARVSEGDFRRKYPCEKTLTTGQRLFTVHCDACARRARGEVFPQIVVGSICPEEKQKLRFALRASLRRQAEPFTNVSLNVMLKRYHGDPFRA